MGRSSGTGRYGADTRQGGQPLLGLLHKGDPPIRRRIARAGQGQTQGEEAGGLEPQVGRAQPRETAQQQPGADQHEQRQAHFAHHQAMAQQAPRARRGPAATAFDQSGIESRVRPLDCRSQTE